MRDEDFNDYVLSVSDVMHDMLPKVTQEQAKHVRVRLEYFLKAFKEVEEPLKQNHTNSFGM